MGVDCIFSISTWYPFIILVASHFKNQSATKSDKPVTKSEAQPSQSPKEDVTKTGDDDKRKSIRDTEREFLKDLDNSFGYRTRKSKKTKKAKKAASALSNSDSSFFESTSSNFKSPDDRVYNISGLFKQNKQRKKQSDNLQPPVSNQEGRNGNNEKKDDGENLVSIKSYPVSSLDDFEDYSKLDYFDEIKDGQCYDFSRLGVADGSVCSLLFLIFDDLKNESSKNRKSIFALPERFTPFKNIPIYDELRLEALAILKKTKKFEDLRNNQLLKLIQFIEIRLYLFAFYNGRSIKKFGRSNSSCRKLNKKVGKVLDEGITLENSREIAGYLRSLVEFIYRTTNYDLTFYPLSEDDFSNFILSGTRRNRNGSNVGLHFIFEGFNLLAAIPNASN